MKKLFLLLSFLAILFGGYAQNSSETVNFIVVSDMGRHGKSEQKNIAEVMSRFVEQNKIEFLAVAGDPIHDSGVKSTDDEEWILKIENVYTAPSLHAIPWYVVSGNHEYNGSVQAILDYSQKSERWNAPARYFAQEHTMDTTGQKILLVYIDTSPLIDKYRNSGKYSDAGKQDMEQQLHWLDSILMVSNDSWKIVIGHHPVYATTNKDKSERTDMQQRVGKILEHRGADVYICGHIHNFQHLKPEGSNVHYVVNSAASNSRKIHEPNFQGLIFGNADPGFTSFSISEKTLSFSFINHQNEQVYSYQIPKIYTKTRQ